jgi:hypothetical protein
VSNTESLVVVKLDHNGGQAPLDAVVLALECGGFSNVRVYDVQANQDQIG